MSYLFYSSSFDVLFTIRKGKSGMIFEGSDGKCKIPKDELVGTLLFFDATFIGEV